MRNMLAFMALVVVIFLGMGWYFGWYQFNATPLANGHEKVTFDVNTTKIKQDVKQKLNNFLNKDGSSPTAIPTSFEVSSGNENGNVSVFIPVPPGGRPQLPTPR